MTHWTDYIAKKISKKPETREMIAGILSMSSYAFLVTLVFFMMIARSCDMCHEIQMMNVTSELNSCYSRLYSQEPVNGLVLINISEGSS